MKTKDQIILGIEDLKNMRCPRTLKIALFSIIPIITIILLYFIILNQQSLQEYDFIPIILFIQTIIILIQVKILRTQSKYSKIPYIPEFNLVTRYFLKSKQREKSGYNIWLENNGDIAHRVNCKIKIGKDEKLFDKLFFDKIQKGGSGKIMDFMEAKKFREQIMRINFSYYDKVGNYIYSRWFKDKDKDDFIVILSGQDQ